MTNPIGWLPKSSNNYWGTASMEFAASPATKEGDSCGLESSSISPDMLRKGKWAYARLQPPSRPGYSFGLDRHDGTNVKAEERRPPCLPERRDWAELKQNHWGRSQTGEGRRSSAMPRGTRSHFPSPTVQSGIQS